MTEEASRSEWVPFGDVARDLIGEQCQYASRMITGRLGSPTLGTGLRFANLDTCCYHDIEIHRDDVDEFVARAKAHRSAQGL